VLRRTTCDGAPVGRWPHARRERALTLERIREATGAPAVGSAVEWRESEVGGCPEALKERDWRAVSVAFCFEVSAW